MLWLCLQFPLLPLEVFTRAEGAARRPVIVTERHRVLCHDARAGESGVSAGISSSTAQALCPELLMIERQPARETSALLGLADWGYRFTSMLALEAPDSLLLEVSGSLRLFGGLPALMRQATRELDERGFTHRAGLAPTPAGAGLLARTHPCCPADIPRWCQDEDRSAFVAGIGALPLERLDVPEKERVRMSRMGFSRIGELLALPRAALGKRFGQDFLDRLLRLSGDKPDPRVPYQPREFFHSELHFLEPLQHSTALLFPMQRMLRELEQFLDRRQSCCQRLDWRLRDAGGHAIRLALPCSLQHNSREALLELTRLKLESVSLREGVESVALSCRNFVPVHQRSATLFRDADDEGAGADELLLDRLALRIGREHIHGLAVADAHLPENAWLDRYDDKRCAATTPGCGERPSWLLHAPLPLQWRAGDLHWRGRLQLLNGPERIESGWWGSEQKRDYFIARHEEDGAVCWIFRERDSRRWFLHGLFG